MRVTVGNAVPGAAGRPFPAVKIEEVDKYERRFGENVFVWGEGVQSIVDSSLYGGKDIVAGPSEIAKLDMSRRGCAEAGDFEGEV